MVVVVLGENVRSVREKIGMEANEYLSLWRHMNVSEVMIFLCMHTLISLW